MKEILFELNHITIDVKFSYLTLRKILDLDLVGYADKIATLVNDASKENDVKTKVAEIEKSLEMMNFNYKPYKKLNEDKGYILKDVTDEMAVLQENITNLQSQGNSKYAGAFKAQINELEQEMNLIMETIEVWVEVQKKWMYLENIFTAQDIKK